MLRKRVNWSERPAERVRLRPPFALGFLAGLALSGAVLLWPVHAPASDIEPVLDALTDQDTLYGPPHIIGVRDA